MEWAGIRNIVQSLYQVAGNIPVETEEPIILPSSHGKVRKVDIESASKVRAATASNRKSSNGFPKSKEQLARRNLEEPPT